MGKLVTFQLDAELVEPLLETLKSRAQAWQETTLILRAHCRKENGKTTGEAAEAAKMASLYNKLIEKITSQLMD